MRKVLISILMFIVLLISFIFWDYRRTGTLLWGENIIQSLAFIIVFFIARSLFDSTTKNRNSNS